MLRTDGRTPDWQTLKMLLSHTLTMGKSCSKFGQIPPTNLGGDRMMDGWRHSQYLHLF